MRVTFHPEVLTEYAEAVQYYTEQRVEVAQAFINAIEDTVYRIRESPARSVAVDDDVRRCMARKFPYGILYTIEQDYILILAVMHCSREPGAGILEKSSVAAKSLKSSMQKSMRVPH